MKAFIIFFSYLLLLICVPPFTNEQVISYSMRKVAYSTNQFGLDLLRASKNDRLVFCPFCISSSLVMLLMGSTGETANSLRHALYLENGLTENEINFAYFDMMNHLGVNLAPTQKQSSMAAAASTNQLNFKTPTVSSGGSSNLDFLNKAGLLSSESQALTLLPNNYFNGPPSASLQPYGTGLNSLDSFGQRLDGANSFSNNYEHNSLHPASGSHLFQPYDFIDRNKIVHPFSPYNGEIAHRNNFIKFSTNQLNGNGIDKFTPLNSDLNTDIKTSNYLFARRTGRAFGFKNGFWNSKSYLNPFGTMLNAFQNNFQNSFQYAPNHPSGNYHQNSIQPPSDLVIEKFGQNMNPALNSIKLPNNFHYYNVKPPNPTGQHSSTTTVSNTPSTNRKQTQQTIASSTSTTELPKQHYSTTIHSYNHQHSFNHPHHYQHHMNNNNNFMKEYPTGPTNDSTSTNHHSVRLGNVNVDSINNNDFSGNDISFLSNIYVQREFAINYHYHVLLQKFYKTAIHPLDFIHNAEETRDHINAIVQMQTDNKICNILPERQLPSTQLLLISALYFRGELDLKLNLTRSNGLGNYQQASPTSGDQSAGGIHYHQHNATTTNLPFNKSKAPSGREQEANDLHNQSEEIWMEASRTRLRYAFDQYLNCSTVEMPFKDSMITLLIMLPSDADGLDTLLTKLNAQMLNDVINSLEIRRITIKVNNI